ncbi:MAG: TfoX/Sxy family protein [Acidobacteriia bacterium]|nr:TfoX/Sxy family protein [Terriglobia bacterium]
MPVSASFLEFVLDQLDACGPITAKRMFGGVGLYAGECFFAVMMDDTIYLKVDDTTRGTYEAAGSRAFNPYPKRPDGGVSTSYFEVPLAVLEDAEELARWAKKSIAVSGQVRPKSKKARPALRSTNRRIRRR